MSNIYNYPFNLYSISSRLEYIEYINNLNKTKKENEIKFLIFIHINLNRNQYQNKFYLPSELILIIHKYYKKICKTSEPKFNYTYGPSGYYNASRIDNICVFNSYYKKNI